MAQTRKRAVRKPPAKAPPPPKDEAEPPNIDPRKPPVTGRGPAPDHEKGRPKDTGRYGA